MVNKKFVLRLKYDLRTKLLLLVGANILIFLGTGLLYEVFLTLFFVGVIVSSGYTKSALKYILFFCISVIVETILIKLDVIFLLNLVLFVMAIVRKFLPCIIIGKWILNSTSSSEAVATLQKLRLPKDALIMISVIFRCFPTIKDEWTHINMAMKTKGINFNLHNLIQRPALTMEYFFVPLFVSVIEIGDELSQSAIVRGLDAPVVKTSRHLIKFSKNDVLVLFFLFFILGAVAFVRYKGVLYD